MVTWGTSPQDASPITGSVPDPDAEPNPERRDGMRRAPAYMDLSLGRRLAEIAIDRVFAGTGFDWRQAGCSMCLGTNGEVVAPGQRCTSTSNRNFVGRQGPGARMYLMSPAMAAAAAVTGHLADVRALGVSA